MKRAAILLSGGTGTRVGAAVPKQYIEVNGRMIISRALDTLVRHPLVDLVVIVAAKEWRGAILAEQCRAASENGSLPSGHNSGYAAILFAEPGSNRQRSIRNALQVLTDNDSDGGGLQRNDAVLIHDAARPCLSADLVTRCFHALEKGRGHDGVLPVLPMKDTVYLCGPEGRDVSSPPEETDRTEKAAQLLPEETDRTGKTAQLSPEGADRAERTEKAAMYYSQEKADRTEMAFSPSVKNPGRYAKPADASAPLRVKSLLPRDEVFCGQAPEAFRFGSYLDAVASLSEEQMDQIHGSTEPAILAGLDVVTIPGDENNFKITTSADLDRFREICGTAHQDRSCLRSRRQTGPEA